MKRNWIWWLVLPAIALASTLVARSPAQGTHSSLVAICRGDTRIPIEHLPYVVVVPGSYIFTKNLTATPDMNGVVHGITVAADDVTIDLNGCTLSAIGGTSGDGLACQGTVNNLTIRNGMIRGWPGTGIRADGSGGVAVGMHAELLHVVANGIDGAALGPRATAERVHCESNGARGLAIGVGSSARDCHTASNQGAGIEAGASCTLESCSSHSNQIGFQLLDSAIAVRCTASSSSTDAFQIGYMSQALSCMVNGAGGHGFKLLGYGMIVRDCTVRDCVDGIRADQAGYCTIAGNVVAACSGAGIHLLSGTHRPRVEGNHVSTCQTGIWDQSASIQVGHGFHNSCGSNGTDYDVASGGDWGPVQSAATGSSPWANF